MHARTTFLLFTFLCNAMHTHTLAKDVSQDTISNLDQPAEERDEVDQNLDQPAEDQVEVPSRTRADQNNPAVLLLEEQKHLSQQLEPVGWLQK